MPGSKTPNPPGSQIHCWPGCHLWTSSCQRISIDLMRLPASALAAASTVEWCCACQVVNSVTLCACGEAVEVGDFGEAGGRRLFEQAVEAGEDAFAGDLIARAGRRGDRDCFEALDAADQLAPVGEGRPTPWPERLEVATSSKRGLAAIDWHVLILGDLADSQ